MHEVGESTLNKIDIHEKWIIPVSVSLFILAETEETSSNWRRRSIERFKFHILQQVSNERWWNGW